MPPTPALPAPRRFRDVGHLRDIGVAAAARVAAPELARLLRATAPYSLLSQRKRVNLWRAARTVTQRGWAGDITEMGAYRGGGAGMFVGAMAGTSRRMHLFDRWGEVPQPTEQDGEFARQNYSRSVELLQEVDARADAEQLMLTDLALPADRVRFYPGWLDDSLPTFDGEPLALAHVDVNLYESTRSVFTFFEDALAPRAMIVLDDWGEAWPGVKQAYAEWERNTKRTLTLRPGRQQAVVEVG